LIEGFQEKSFNEQGAFSIPACSQHRRPGRRPQALQALF
jgi:hypothetical protein